MEEKKKGQRGRFCDSGDNSLCAAAMSGYKGHQCQRRQKTRGASVHALARWHGRTRALPSGEDGVWEVEGRGWDGVGGHRDQRVSTRSCSVLEERTK